MISRRPRCVAPINPRVLFPDPRDPIRTIEASGENNLTLGVCGRKFRVSYGDGVVSSSVVIDISSKGPTDTIIMIQLSILAKYEIND